MKRKLFPWGLGILWLLSSSVTASADDAFGDWNVSVSAGFRIAKTSNDLATVGIGCLGDSDCFAYLASKMSSCEEGHSTAFLLSSPGGVSSTQAVCKRVGGVLLNVFENMDALRAVILNDTGFKIVIPMGDGAFQISGFSARGAISALRTLAGTPSNQAATPPAGTI